MQRSRLRIVVTGLAATYPFGGVFWDYIQYVEGLRRLGHEVLYLEDTGKWCYSPTKQTFVEDGAENAAFLAKQLTELQPELADAWFYRDGKEQCFGRPWSQVVEFCRTADLFLHISASCWMRDEYMAARTLAFIDSDPMYTQASVPQYLDGTIDEAARSRIDTLRQHDVFFSFGLNFGRDDCLIPRGVFDWHPTVQPVVLDLFESARVPVPKRERMLTTVGSWEPTEKGPVIDGVMYAGKSVELQRMIDLPGRVSMPIELALAGPAPRERLIEHGWQVREAYEVSYDPWVYRDYLAHSLAEWSVAKHAYAAGRTGWFSTRTACYLALGVPAVVQDTGFDHVIPTGVGLLTFHDVDSAAQAIEQVVAEPQRHAEAALTLAREYLDAGRVLTALLDTVQTAGGSAK